MHIADPTPRQSLAPGARPGAAACLHALVEGQAARTPDVPALVYGAATLSYAELNARANQVTRELQARGAGPDVAVGLCLERGPELIIGLLGILKAGGAYVPLDPNYPADRLAYIRADAGLALLLTQRRLAERLPVGAVPVVCVDDLALDGVADTANPDSGVTPANLAYIIYTSGSTGRPKGVLVSHQGIANLAAMQSALFGVGPGDRVLQYASISFDASVYEIVLALTHGAALVLAHPDDLLPGPGLIRLLDEQGITIAPLFPAVLTALPAAPLPRLRAVNVGGDVCTAEMVARWAPGRQFVNAYGPTEATVAVTVAECRADGQPPTIGRPIPNTQVYLLDDAGAAVPDGAIGELYLGGAGLARGYHGRPDLTAERFVPDPLSGEPGARLYRTGDLARRRPDGEIEFLGRRDFQVKVRGFRIELGEIAAVLGGHPAVRDSVVLARPNPQGEQVLVAYLVPDGAAPAAADLRAFLRRTLPEYMIPAHFVSLVSWPLTSNGKIDRRALPAPATDMTTAYVAPRTPEEETVAGIWAEVLGVDRVGAEDNFFELGGHSLRVGQVLARVRAAFGVEVPARAFFAAPTVAGLVAAIAATGAAEAPITPVDSNAPLALSPAQQWMWLLHELDPLSAVYNVPLGVRLRGPLDEAALRASLAELTARQEALRTTLPAIDGQPVQVVAADMPVPLIITDLTDLPQQEREAAAQAHLAADLAAGFDLARGPLWRVLLLRLAPDDHIMLLTLHHSIADGWSVGLIAHDLSALYAAHRHGAAADLPALPVQYADYAAWQQEWLRGPGAAAELAWWRATLAGAPHFLPLPTDHPRPSTPGTTGAVARFQVPAALLAQAQTLARQEGATLFMTLLAACNVLLARYSGQDDLLVGTPAANRGRAELEPLVGMFVNTLVIRTDLGGRPTFREALRRVRAAALGAYAHPDLPFARLVAEVQPERDRSASPLVQVMVALQADPGANLALPGIQTAVLPLDNGTAKLDLTLSFWEAGAGLDGTIEYNTGLFEPATIDRLAAHLLTLLEAAAHEPDVRIGDLPLLPADEQAQVLTAWNATAAPYPQDRTLPELIAAQAARTPEVVAVVFGDTHLTYAELNARANQLAHCLRTLGVGPDVLVALCVERSLDMVVALLAILKAGGAYIPLDPTYPRERLHFMLADAQPAVVLTQRHLLEALPDRTELRSGLQSPKQSFVPPQVICLDDASAAWTGQPATDPAPAQTPDHLAYIIYTSGSTGTPKGVQVTGRSLVNLLAAMQTEIGVTADDVLAAVTSLSFDIAGLELYLPLISGARLAVVPRDRAMDGAGLAAYLDTIGATILQATPATWKLLLAAEWAPRVSPKALCGGEALPAGLAQALLPRTAALWNVYGPTETTIWSTAARVTDGGPISIGRPLANQQVYVLDGQGRPAPVGVPGDLYIGGAGLARGYRGRPDLTAERFVPDPFGGTPGARLYATGDRARWRADGRLDFLGRGDSQVKIRGFRIEPGEVEAVLARAPGVREAVVLARESGAGDPQLAGYVVAQAGTTVDSAAVQEHLRAHLPAYMLPAALLVLDAWPLTPNGKIDRRALPAPDLAPVAAYVAPRTPVEETVAGIWAEVLEREQVGVEDNFFDLGGHSLRAAQVLARVRTLLGADIPLRVFFQVPTVAGLAAAVSASAGTPGVALEPIPPADRNGPLPLAPAQQWMWLLHELDPASASYNLPLAFRLGGPLDEAALRASFTALSARHETLRTTLPVVDGAPIQVIAPDPLAPLTVRDLRGVPATEREAAADRELRADLAMGFDLASSPLWRVLLLRLAADDHILLLTLHHSIADGWSQGVLMRELAAIYAAQVAEGGGIGPPLPGAAGGHIGPPLPELPVQYADYAVWQREWLASAEAAAQLDAWRTRLAGAPRVLALPTDRPRPAEMTSHGAVRHFTLPAGLATRLRALSRQEGSTLFMTLLAASAVLFGRYSRQDDLLIGTPVANRTRPELEGLVGMFVNTLVVRADLTGNLTFRGLLARIRSGWLESSAHQELPFETLVAELQPDRDPSYSPLVQVMVALQNTPDAPSALADLNVEPLPVEMSTSRLDLTLAFEEAPDGLAGMVEYNTDLFTAATVKRMLGHLTTLLDAVTAHPDRRLADLPLLTAAERKQLLVEWTATDAPYPQDRCWHELVAEQAARTPDAIALAAGDRPITYSELNARANQLARALQARGVKPDVPVGLWMTRSPELIVGLLGILKAGGAYVPLDPAYPADRLAYIVADAGICLVLTRGGLAPVLPDGVTALRVDALPAPGPADAANPAGGVTLGNLAYLIYTSGSTGRPKGVMITHQNLANYAALVARTFAPAPADRVLLFTSISFDASVFDLVCALTAGATLVLAPPDLLPGVELARLLADECITIAGFVPAVVGALPDTPLPALRTLIVGGEACPDDLVRRWAPGRQFVNAYGPTETTVDATHAICEAQDGPFVVPIGRPVANSHAYVLDPAGAPTPVGVPGELYVGGAGLARGYLGRPDLTAERFVPDPYSGVPGARLYRTGDLVRWRPDGQIEFLGRVDHQVKLRGFRIELGEIEATLLAHPAVQAAAVLVREDRPGDKQLVAYVQGHSAAAANGAPDVAGLRAFLGERLPAYMVPGAFVVLPALPLLPNGKLDRRALPAPDTLQPAADQPYTAPRSDLETVLAGIWEGVLGRSPIGIHDNFYALGGHSLRAAQIAAQIREDFAVEVPLRTLLAAPTVAELAAALLADPAQRELIERTAEMLVMLASLSDEEAEALLQG